MPSSFCWGAAEAEEAVRENCPKFRTGQIVKENQAFNLRKGCEKELLTILLKKFKK